MKSTEFNQGAPETNQGLGEQNAALRTALDEVEVGPVVPASQVGKGQEFNADQARAVIERQADTASLNEPEAITDLMAAPENETGKAGHLRRRFIKAFDRMKPGMAKELHEHDEWRDNLDLLADSGDVGQLLAPFYKIALRRHPELAKVRIVSDAREPGGSLAFHASPDWTEGKHTVNVSLDAYALHDTGESLSQFADARAHYAREMNVPEDELTAEDVMVFRFLHELGHTVEFVGFENNPEAWKQRQAHEDAARPVPGLQNMAVRSPEARAYMADHWQELSSRTGAGTIDELIAMHLQSRLNMAGEVYADRFAAREIALGKTLLNM
jgi:hypothetical protein